MCGDAHVTVRAEWEHVTRKMELQGAAGGGGVTTVYSRTTLAPGYSVAVLHRADGFSYVAGAPRHKLRGAVFELLKKDTFVRQIEGEQVPPGEVTFPSVGALRPWGHGWAHPGQG